MEIEFEVTLDDYFAFNDHLTTTSSFMKVSVRKGQAWWAAGPILGVMLWAICKKIPFEKTIIIIAIVASILSIPALFFYPLYFKWYQRKYIKKNCESEKNKGIIGIHTIEITDDNFREKTAFNDTAIPWKGIYKLETTKDHIFIFINDIAAYIVPRHSLSAETYNIFAQEIMRIYNKNKG